MLTVILLHLIIVSNSLFYSIETDPYELDKRFHSHLFNKMRSDSDTDYAEFIATQKQNANTSLTANTLYHKTYTKN